MVYDDLRNDRLGDRVRLEQERVKYQLVQEAVLALHRWVCELGVRVIDATLRTL